MCDYEKCYFFNFKYSLAGNKSRKGSTGRTVLLQAFCIRGGFIFIGMKYFLHDTNSFDDEKITELYLKFGYEGLGLFYTALEKIGKQEKPVKTTVLKAQLKIGKKLNKCWSFMEEIGLLSSNNGDTFNKQLLNFSEKYQIKKEKNKLKVAEWRKNQEDKENVTGYVPTCNPPKVKESKVKESKVSKEEASKSPDFIDELLNCFVQEHGSYEIMSKGKERTAMSTILKKYKEKYPAATTKETVEGLRVYFKQCINIPDVWLMNNMSPSIMVSKFNEINKILRNGTAKKIGTTPEQLIGSLEKGVGTEFLKGNTGK